MKIGVLAFEHPPANGGMERLAAMHIGHLAASHELVVYSRDEAVDAKQAGVRYEFGLTSDPRDDLPRLQREDVDVWLIFNSGLAPYIASLTAPSVVVAHGNDFLRPWLPRLPVWARAVGRLAGLFGSNARHEFERRFRGRMIAGGFESASKIVANSNFTRGACLAHADLAPEKVEVVHPSLAAEWFAEGLKRTRHTSNTLNLLTVCRVVSSNRRKNIDGVLRALAEIGDDISFTYTVAGDGDDLPWLRDLTEKLGLSSRVNFLGRVSSEELTKAYLDADLFVMPVRATPNDFEGFGMVFSEAAATGLPSLATKLGGIPDAVQEGVSGILLDSADPHAIALGLRDFAQRRDDFDVEQIRAFADAFNIERVAPRLEDILLDAASHRRRGPQTA